MVKKEALSPETLKHVEKHHPGAFSHGNTVRRGDLVLASCPVDVNRDYKAHILSKAKEQEQRVTPSQFDKKGQKIFEEKVSDEQVAADIIDRFKK